MPELLDRYFADRQRLGDASGVPRHILRLTLALHGHTTADPVEHLDRWAEGAPRFFDGTTPLLGFPEPPAPEQS